MNLETRVALLEARQPAHESITITRSIIDPKRGLVGIVERGAGGMPDREYQRADDESEQGFLARVEKARLSGE